MNYICKQSCLLCCARFIVFRHEIHMFRPLYPIISAKLNSSVISWYINVSNYLWFRLTSKQGTKLWYCLKVHHVRTFQRNEMFHFQSKAWTVTVGVLVGFFETLLRIYQVIRRIHTNRGYISQFWNINFIQENVSRIKRTFRKIKYSTNFAFIST